MTEEYCENCGALIEGNSGYCDKCGGMSLSMKKNIEKDKEEKENLILEQKKIKEEKIKATKEKIKASKDSFLEKVHHNRFGKIGSYLAALIGIFLVFCGIILLVFSDSMGIMMILFGLISLVPLIHMHRENNEVSAKMYIIYALISLIGGMFIIGFVPAILFFIAAISKHKIS